MHRRLGLALLSVVLCVSVVLVLRLDFKEDITDFLPVDEHYRRSMQIYQEVASADKVVLLFGPTGQWLATQPDSTAVSDTVIAAVERYGELLSQRDTAGWIAQYAPQVDYDQVLDVVEFVYDHLPYLLDEADYARIDSMLQNPGFLDSRWEWIRGQLSSLSSPVMMPILQRDPLGMANSVAAHLRDFQPEVHWQQRDGYLFTPDGRQCIVTLDSPFGSSETSQNGRLVEMLEDVAADMSSHVEVRMTGAPVIAVGNASQIRRDTTLSVIVSVVLILALLLVAFRSLRSLWYIALSTGFGFLIALAGVAMLGQSLSLIVIGIASVIIGIAVNYPLHFVCHSQEVQGGRSVLSDLVQPLLVGNITTVAAFLTLVPLEAVAIRQLGLFSALMLVGTILFVLLIMPHMSQSRMKVSQPDAAPRRMVGERLVTQPVSLIVLLLLTVVFGWFSLRTEFDSNLSHLNYMSDGQRADMQMLQSVQGQPAGVVVYLPASQSEMETLRPVIDSLHRAGLILDEKNAVSLVPSASVQQQRLAMWNDFWRRHNYLEILNSSKSAGFSDEAFEPFQLMIEESHPLLEYRDFETLTSSVLTGYVSPTAFVTRLTVADVETAAEVEAVLPGSFDLTSLNALVAKSLTDNFNYIGLACALIVFLFLWLSFGRIELAILAFTPMAVGWLWILGLMQLMGIQFNIVNVILATFIFGQGDDYTIFITEGLIRDYRNGSGRHTLISYQRSILLSALIMLVGIGSLILAKHPAMHSLAEVTIIGMTVVLIMAWLLPPMLFHWLVKLDRPLREYLMRRND